MTQATSTLTLPPGVRTPLPDVSRMLDLPAESWQKLGARLFELELPAAYYAVASIGGDLFEPATRPLRNRALRRRDQLVDRALRLFSFGDPVTEEEAHSVLGDALLGELGSVGLVVREGDRRVSPFRLRAAPSAPAGAPRGILFFADSLGHGGDAIMGMGPLTGSLLRASLPSGPIERALDLGCGAGFIALALSPIAATVVASDINERARVLTHLNAALNGITNIEIRIGDLFAPVQGERFDRIVCQPPFFPAPEGFLGATFMHGGRRGDELAMRVFAELPRHLSARGRGAIIVELPEVAGQPVATRIRSVLPLDTNLLVLESEGPDADAFCMGDTAFAHPDFGPEYERSVLLQRDHLERIGIERLRICLAIVEPASGQTPGNPEHWTGTLEVRDVSDPSVNAALVDTLVEANAAVHRGRESLLAQKLRIREGASFVPDKGDRVRVLFSAAGPLAEIQLDRGAHRIVEMVSSAPNVQAAAKRFTRESSGPRTTAQERFLAAVEQMLLAGILEVVLREIPAQQAR